MLKIEPGVSSESFAHLSPYVARRAVNYVKKNIRIEWAPKNADELINGEKPGAIITGAHLRRANSRNVRDEVRKAMESIGNVVQSNRLPIVTRPYVSVHADPFFRLSDDEFDSYLTEIDREAGERNIDFLIENTTPRIDSHNKIWAYDLDAFVARFRPIIEKCPNIHFNFDIAHLGRSTETAYRVMDKVFKAAIDGIPIGTMLLYGLTKEELQVYKNLEFVLSHTKVLHWSRTRGVPTEEGKIFRAIRGIVQRFPKQMDSFAELLQGVYSKIENATAVHISVISNPSLFIELLMLLDNFNFQGLYIIESSGMSQIGRELQEPFLKELGALKIYTQILLAFHNRHGRSLLDSL